MVLPVLLGCSGVSPLHDATGEAGSESSSDLVNTAQVRGERRQQLPCSGLLVSKAFPVRGESITIAVGADRADPGDHVVVTGKNMERVRLRLSADLQAQWTTADVGPVTVQLEGSEDSIDRQPLWVVSHPVTFYWHRDYWPLAATAEGALSPEATAAALDAIRGMRCVSAMGTRSAEGAAYWRSRGALVLTGAPHRKSEDYRVTAAGFTNQKLRAGDWDGFHMDETFITDWKASAAAGFRAVLTTRAIFGSDYFIGLYCGGAASRYQGKDGDPVRSLWAMRNADGAMLDECYGGPADLQYTRYLMHLRLPRSVSGLMALLPGRERSEEERDVLKKAGKRIYSGLTDFSESILAEIAMIRRNQPSMHKIGAWNLISAQDTIAFDKALEAFYLQPTIHLRPREGKLEAHNIGQDYAEGVVLEVRAEDGSILEAVPLRRLAPDEGQLVELPPDAQRVTLKMPNGMEDLYAERTAEKIPEMYRFAPAGYVIPDELNPLQVVDCSIDEHAVLALPPGAPLEIAVRFNRPLGSSMFDEAGRFVQEAAVQLLGVESGALKPDSISYDPAALTLRLRYDEPARDYYSLALIATDQKQTYGFRDENGLPMDGDGDGNVRRWERKRPRGLGGDFTRHFIVNATDRLSAVTWTSQDLGGGHVLQSGQAEGLLEFREHEREHPVRLEQGSRVSLLGNFSGDGTAELALFDPDGAEVCRFRATPDRRRYLLNDVPVKVSGEYRLQVRLLEQNPILYDVDLLVGGRHEIEPQGIARNELPGASEPVCARGAGRAEIVAGTVGNALHDGYRLSGEFDERDDYALDLRTGETVSMHVQFLDGFGIAELCDTEGRVVVASDDVSAMHAPARWTATVDGTCSVRVRRFARVNPERLPANARYVLGIARDATFASLPDNRDHGLVWHWPLVGNPTAPGVLPDRIAARPLLLAASGKGEPPTVQPTGGVRLNGKDQRLRIETQKSSGPGLNEVMNGTASLALWVKTTAVGCWQTHHDRQVLRGPTLSGGRYAAGPYLLWGQLDEGGRLNIFQGRGSEEHSALVGKTKINDGAWHHVVLSRNAEDGTLRIIVDGREDAAGPGRPGVLSNYLRYYSLGCSDGTGNPMRSDFWPGELNDIRVYARELTMNEVRSLYDR